MFSECLTPPSPVEHAGRVGGADPVTPEFGATCTGAASMVFWSRLGGRGGFGQAESDSPSTEKQTGREKHMGDADGMDGDGWMVWRIGWLTLIGENVIATSTWVLPT